LRKNVVLGRAAKAFNQNKRMALKEFINTLAKTDCENFLSVLSP
jgi:hypothetical protein